MDIGEKQKEYYVEPAVLPLPSRPEHTDRPDSIGAPNEPAYEPARKED